jgi:formylglycine-generating enzyme required for sulfatase activity
MLRLFRKKQIEILPEDRVKLPVLLGVRPGRYLMVLYAAAILLALFLILVYPGLARPGAVGAAVSEPSGAAVRVDGVTLGAAPCEIFLPKGKHNVEMVLPGFESYSVEITVKGRIFASLFFPQKMRLSGKLTTHNPAAALALEAADFARWALAGEAAEASQAPLSLSEGAYRAGPAAKETAGREQLNRVIGAAARFAVTKAAARDILRAAFLTGNGGLSPSPLTLLRSAREAASFMDAAPPGSLAAWLAGFGVEDAPLRALAEGGEKQDGALFTSAAAAPFDAPFTVNGEEFIPVPGGTFFRNGARRVFPPLYAARAETSRAAWDAFITENPEWAAENCAELIARGLVSRDYLLSVDHPAYPEPAMPGVSWYAARAYCVWLSEKLPPSLRDAGWEVRLPTETEWEAAAIYLAGRVSAGSLWEWCDDFFAPLDFPADPEALAAVGSSERTVKGGSWVNPPGSVNAAVRGSLPPASSSPFTGFRPVIVRRNSDAIADVP